MKIVIDIEEGRYNWIMSHASKHPYDYADASDLFFRTAVESGIVLPKGHGDLIDRSKLAFFRCPNNVKDCPPEYDFTCQNCDFGVTSRFRVDAAPVIIPADKEDKDEDSN